MVHSKLKQFNTKENKALVDMTKLACLLHGKKFSTAEFVILSILEVWESSYYGLSIGEIQGFYIGETGESYSYSGIAAMLRKLANKKYVKVSKDGRYNSYSLTAVGKRRLNEISAAF